MKPSVLIAGIAAAALLALGLFLGFRPLTADGHKCGSAFSENQYLLATGQEACDEKRSDATPLALVLLVGGVAAGASSVVLRRSAPAVHESVRRQ